MGEEQLAPHFQVTIDGSPLPPDREPLSVSVDTTLDQPDMCVVVISNKDLDLPAALLDFGSAIEVKLSKPDGSLQSAFKGEVVSMEPTYSNIPKNNVFLVRAFHKMHRLLRGRFTRTYQNQSDQDIVKKICSERGLSAMTDGSPTVTHAHVYQHNQMDLEFIRSRAARLGFNLWCEGDSAIHFGVPKFSDSPTELEFVTSGSGGALISFAPRMSIAGAVDAVEVRGWDPEKKEEIVGTASSPQTHLSGSPGGNIAKDAIGAAKSFEVDTPIFSSQEADNIAKARLAERGMAFVTADGEVTGNVALRAGGIIKVTVGGGTRAFDGKYLLSTVTHVMTKDGFKTRFRASRDAR